MTRAQKHPGGRPGTVRIIGGSWRGRRLPVTDVEAVRPTPDRVRETLFNWLAPRLPGASCLDACAGTGVLGLEALSRGAAQATFVERDPRVAATLRQTIDRLGARARVIRADVMQWLSAPAPERFDVVFLDPPYAANELTRLCTLLDEQGWLAGEACVYLEAGRRQDWPALPPGWQIHRQGTAGEIRFGLAVQGRAAPGPHHPTSDRST